MKQTSGEKTRMLHAKLNFTKWPTSLLESVTVNTSEVQQNHSAMQFLLYMTNVSNQGYSGPLMWILMLSDPRILEILPHAESISSRMENKSPNRNHATQCDSEHLLRAKWHNYFLQWCLHSTHSTRMHGVDLMPSKVWSID